MVARSDSRAEAYEPRNSQQEEERRSLLQVHHQQQRLSVSRGSLRLHPPPVQHQQGPIQPQRTQRPPVIEEHRSLLSAVDGVVESRNNGHSENNDRSKPFAPSSSSSTASSASGGMRRRRTSGGSRRSRRGTPKSRTEQLADRFFGPNWNVTRIMSYFLMSAFIGVMTFWILRRENRNLHELQWGDYAKTLHPGPREQSCFKMKHNDKRCTCPSPHIPLQNTASFEWKMHHNRLIEMVNRAHTARTKLDVVMIGDDSIERWNGTSALGTIQHNGMRNVFNQYFSKSNGAKLEGLALGATGDTGPNVLWMLQQGVIDKLDPKIWFINVGRTDLFVNRCTNRFVIAGILNVVKELHVAKPDAQFILHGILPRLDPSTVYDNGDNLLGEYWHRAQRINQELKRFSRTSRNIWYMQSTSALLLTQNKREDNGRKPIDTRYFEKGVNITAPGLRVWGKRIVEKIDEIEESVKAAKLAEASQNKQGGQRRLGWQNDDVYVRNR